MGEFANGASTVAREWCFSFWSVSVPVYGSIFVRGSCAAKTAAASGVSKKSEIMGAFLFLVMGITRCVSGCVLGE